MTTSVSYRKIFVVGCPRSGTSWVTNLIASHPRVVTVPIETHVYPLIYEPFVRLPDQGLRSRLCSWKGIIRRYGPLPLLLGFESSDIWRGIWRDYQILNKKDSHGPRLLADSYTFKALLQTAQSRPGRDLQKAEQVICDLFDLFFSRQGHPGDTFLEKTPMHIRYVDRILSRFPEARVVEVIRDGRDVCASYKALAQQYAWASLGTDGVMRQWKDCIEHGERWRANDSFSKRIQPIRYEHLSQDPRACLQQIFEFAALDWTAPQISATVEMADIRRVKDRAAGEYVRKGAVGDWRQSLSAAELEICEAVAGSQLRLLGYTDR
ncbi:MAG: sulfotransferase [Cyanobacteria bacterium J06598_1]